MLLAVFWKVVQFESLTVASAAMAVKTGEVDLWPPALQLQVGVCGTPCSTQALVMNAHVTNAAHPFLPRMSYSCHLLGVGITYPLQGMR